MGSGEDQAGKRRDGGTLNIEPCAEVVPVADAELGAGLGEREEGIARIATAIRCGSRPRLCVLVLIPRSCMISAAS